MLPVFGPVPTTATDPIAAVPELGHSDSMQRLTKDVIKQLPLVEIDKVTFYKRDQVTTDLICCDVAIADKVWSFHEELPGWKLLIDHLHSLPNFRVDWFVSVSRPPFSTSETIAFCR